MKIIRHPCFEHPHANVNLRRRPHESVSLQNLGFNWSKMYVACNVLSEDCFAQVSEGYFEKDGRISTCILKTFSNVCCDEKIIQELRAFYTLQECRYILRYSWAVRKAGNPLKTLVFEGHNSIAWDEVVENVSASDIKRYLHQMLTALNQCHSHGIIHRNICPTSFIIGPMEIRLTNFMQSVLYYPHKNYDTFVKELNYASPEVLLGIKKQNYSLDLWGVGCLFASFLFRKKHRKLFERVHEKDDDGEYNKAEALVKIAKILGRFELHRYLARVNLKRTVLPLELQQFKIDVPDFKRFSNGQEKNKDVADDEALDLLGDLLRYNPDDRCTAAEALSHKYFRNFQWRS